MKKMKKKTKILGIGLGVVVTFILATALFIQNQLAPLNTNKEVIVNVKKGSNLKTVLKTLQEDGIIKNAFLSEVYLKLTNQKINLISGGFKVSSNDNVSVIFDKLSNINNMIPQGIKVALIEGKWAIHYAITLENQLGIKKEAFLNKWNDKAYLKSLQEKYWFLEDALFNKEVKVLLEGYLAPDTYFFEKEDSVEKITEEILDNTLKRLNPLKQQLTGKNVHEILTKASLVQYEANTYEDMRKIAYITDARLNQNMKLQYSVTVCYSLYEKLSDWKQCEFRTDIDSKYNTYLHSGLPPGPINNPSLQAIQAVFNPIENPNLFFVADVCNTNKIYYSKTYEEHEKLVDKYLRSTKCLP